MSKQIYEIIRTARGRSTAVAEGTRQKMQDRLDQLRSSTRGGRVSGRTQATYRASYAMQKKIKE